MHEDASSAASPSFTGNQASGSRRRFLDILLGGSFVAWAAVVLYPVLKYLKPPPESGGGGDVTLTDDEKRKIAQNGFVIIRMGTDRVIVFRDSKQKIHALSAKCTHEGCTVTFKVDEGLVWCACHNGKFAPDGRVISGPPPRPLAVYAARGDLGGALVIGRQGA